MKHLKDSIDAELLAEKYLDKFKVIDGELYTDNEDMKSVKEFTEELKTSKPNWFNASGVAGSGTTGKQAKSNGDYFTVSELENMSEAMATANIAKVNSSLAYHAKNK